MPFMQPQANHQTMLMVETSEGIRSKAAKRHQARWEAYWNEQASKPSRGRG